MGFLSSYGRGVAEKAKGNLVQAHPFLKYASAHWISHTTRFRKGSTASWDLWHQIATYGHDLAERPDVAGRPWPEQQEFDAQDPNFLDWSL